MRTLLLKQLLLLILLCVFSNQSFAEVDPWRGTELNFSQIRDFLKDQSRLANEKGLVAMYKGLQTLVSEISDSEGLSLTSQTFANKFLGKNSTVLLESAGLIIGKNLLDFANDGLNEENSEKVANLEIEETLDFLSEFSVTSSLVKRAMVFSAIIDWIETKYVTSENEESLTAGFINSYYAHWHDPHTYIIPKSLLLEETQDEGFSLVGIGIKFIELKEGYRIVEVLPNSPAREADLHAGDVLTAVDGQRFNDTQDLSKKELILGEEDSSLVVTLLRNKQELKKQLIRKKVTFKNVSKTILGNQNNESIAHIKIDSFMSESTCRDLIKSLKDQAQWKGIILDLRENGGGDLELTECVLGLFLGAELPVVDLRNPVTNEVIESYLTSHQKLTSKPMVLLINGDSASASEIVAGAFKEYGRAFIVGTRSFGKGTVQAISKYKKFKNIRIAETIGRFHFPSGWSNQSIGITPDFEIFQKNILGEIIPEDLSKEAHNIYPILASKSKFKKSQKQINSEKQIGECVTEHGIADSIYKEKERILYSLPDYQLAYAIDILSCVNKGAI